MRNLVLFDMSVIWIVSNPSFTIKFLEFLKNERIVLKLGVFFTVDANSCDELVVSLWHFLFTIDARKNVFVNIYRKWNRFIQFKSLAALVFIKRLHFDNQNMRSETQKLLREKSVIEAISASLCSGMDIKVVIQLISRTTNSLTLKT